MPLPGEAVMYRNFIDRAGPRAIGVGYDEGLNLAFDANQMRLAILWRGEFMDGGRHWTGRGQGFQPPAGEEAFYFPNGDAFANLKKSDDPWPDPEERSSLVRFRGYHLNQRQQPTFRYSIEPLSSKISVNQRKRKKAIGALSEELKSKETERT